ncbi:MAG: alpha/beta fold hydrolase [Acidobacteria bacterium]|nr:alpha/beta fold hydrolase [Acidobacteriota bacterium]
MCSLLAAALLFANIGDLPLDSGKVLNDVKMGYRTYGKLNADKSNVILIPAWFNGRTSDLEAFIGAGNLFDDTKWYIVTMDSLSNGVSTSSSNSATQKGKLFPAITIGDMVRAQYVLVTEKLSLPQAHAVIGISMGGMQAFEWMYAYPNFMKQAIPIVGTPRMSAKDAQLWASMVNQLPIGKPRDPASAEGQMRTVMNFDPAQILKWIKPTDVLRQFDAVTRHDIGRRKAISVETAAKDVKAKVLVVIASADQVVSPAAPRAFAELLKAQLIDLQGSCGHNAFRCEKETLAPQIAAFLDGK